MCGVRHDLQFGYRDGRTAVGILPVEFDVLGINRIGKYKLLCIVTDGAVQRSRVDSREGAFVRGRSRDANVEVFRSMESIVITIQWRNANTIDFVNRFIFERSFDPDITACTIWPVPKSIDVTVKGLFRRIS